MRPAKHQTGHEADRPILITEAPVNAVDEFDHRRKRYLLMMGLRALCIIGAATTFRFSGWLAAAFVAAAVVLPWAAVLIANDRPPKQEMRFRRFLDSGPHTPALTAGDAEQPNGPSEQDGPSEQNGPSKQDGPTATGRSGTPQPPKTPTIIDI